MSPGSQHNWFNLSSLIFYKDYLSSLIFGTVLVCRRPRQLLAMRVQIVIPNLEPNNPSLEKLPIGIIETDHTANKIPSFDAAVATDSKRQVNVPRITTQLVFFFLIFDKSCMSSLKFDMVLVCRRPRQLLAMHVQISIPNLEPVNPSLEESEPAFR